MKHYCCIVSEVMPENMGTRVVMLVARSDWPITQSRDLWSDPPIVGRVVALSAKRFDKAEPGYGRAFIIAMAQEVEAAMRRGSFPPINLEIPDALVAYVMHTHSLDELDKYSLGKHFLGLVVYPFSI
jgi:hypothetical protein